MLGLMDACPYDDSLEIVGRCHVSEGGRKLDIEMRQIEKVNRLSIKLARETRELAITPEGVRWAGRTDPEPDAPIVACELPVVLEAGAIAKLVERAPIPSALLHELAARCPPGGDDEDADPRWRRARAAAAIARGEIAVEVDDDTGTCVDRGVDAMRVLPDGTIARLRGTEVAIGDAPPIALPVVERALYALPRPLAPDAIEPDQTIVFLYRDGHLTLFAYGTDGRELARVEGPIQWYPDRVSHGRAGYWVHDDEHHLLLGGQARAEHRPYMRDGATVSGRWLLAIDDRELAWVSLDTAERRAFPWGHEVRGLVRVDDVLWCATSDGMWRLRGGEPPVLVWLGSASGVSVGATHAWVSASSAVVAIELASGDEVWRTTIGHDAHVLYAFDTGIVACGSWQFTILAPDGRILATTDERRDVGVAQLADGTFAASCGEQVVIVDAAGTVRRALPMPYDGQIVGATSNRFVFGLVSGGVDRVQPTALVAFDRTGRVTSRFVPPSRALQAHDARVYVLDYDAKEIRAWDPRGTTRGIAPPTQRVPTERGVKRVGYEVINPRDDWPQVGVEVHADFLALDGTYGGSVGQAKEVPLRVGDGAIATFVRCDLTIGGEGSIAERASTIFLIDCKLPSGVWSIGSACHLVILGGQVAGDLRIQVAPTATVTVDGLMARRVGEVYLVTNAARGIPVVVDGVTYAWEEDWRSPGYGPSTRGTSVSFIHITGDDGTSISFQIPRSDLQSPGWWKGHAHVTTEVIERAIRIATRSGSQRLRMLTTDEVIEAFDGSVRTITDELTSARAALDGLRQPDADAARASFVRSMLAVGCTASDREVIDDWVASHANELVAARAGLQALLDEVRVREYVFATRSAIAILIDMCARMNVDLRLDTKAADAELARLQRAGPKPWGIPESHWWWDCPTRPKER